jgi:hypothetical protein
MPKLTNGSFELIEEAKHYLKLGAPVGPAEGKAIKVPKWSTLTPTDFFQDKYLPYWQKATGIGVICGEQSKIICVDIDTEDKELIKKITAKLPPILSGKIGNPNRRPAQFFRYNGEKSKKFIDIGVEILSNGNQTIIPPSKHPKFSKYQWIGTPLHKIDIDDLPTLPEGFIEFLEQLNDESKKYKTKLDNKTSSENANVNLPEYSPGRCRHGSHNKLSALGVALVKKNYDFDRLVNRLLKEDRKYNFKADKNYFSCPSRNWKHKQDIENAKDFVDELFMNHGPGGRKVEKRVEEPAVNKMSNDFDIFKIPPIPREIVTEKNGKEKEIEPSQAEIAKHILNHFGTLVRKYDKDVFSYNGLHWVEWTDAEKQKLSIAITELFDGKTGVTKVKQIEEFVLKLMKPFSSNPYIQNPFIANFLDGVLEAKKNEDSFTLHFRPHSQDDNCLYVLPMKYNVDRNIKNEKFLSMIETTTGGNAEKIRQIKQMYGVVLMPIFPHLFLNVGVGGTGKSSVIKCAMRLRNQDSMSFTDPTSWGESFGLEPMLGRLVNIDLDIETHKPISDAIVKKIEDRHLFPINRKNKKIVTAPIPTVHIFGANMVPPTLEWSTKAHDRRWTFIKYDSFDGSDNSDRDYSLRAFDSCPEGVLNFALEGLEDIIKSKGKFYQSDESKQLIAEWQLSNDPVGSFFYEITKPEDNKHSGAIISTVVCQNFPNRMTPQDVLVTFDRNDKDSLLERKKMWALFCDWHLEAYKRHPKIGKIKFFEALRRLKIAEKTIDGCRHFCGITLKPIGSI